MAESIVATFVGAVVIGLPLIGPITGIELTPSVSCLLVILAGWISDWRALDMMILLIACRERKSGGIQKVPTKYISVSLLS